MTSTISRASGIFVAVLLPTIAWGILAFGAVYPWAYRPLLAGALLAGAIGIWRGRTPVPRRTVAALILVAGAIALQLVAIPRPLLAGVSPRTHTLLLAYDVQYANAPPTTWHALTMNARQTELGLAFVVAYTILLAATTRMLTRHSAWMLAIAITALGVLVALIGIVQSAFGTKAIYGFWKPMFENAASFGPFVNKNHFAGFILMVLPVGMGVFISLASAAARLSRTGWRNRLLWIGEPETSQAIVVAFGCVTMAIALLMTFSRSGTLCVIAGCVIGACVFAGRKRKGLLAISWALCAPTIAAAWVGVDRIADRFAKPEVLSLAGRIGIWRDTLHIMRDFPIVGTGFNTYGLATFFYQTTMPLFHVEEAHNDYLQIAAEGGLLVGIPATIAIVMFAIEVRRRFQDSRANYWIRAGAVTGVICIALQSLVDFSLQMPGNAALFAVLCGIALHRNESLRTTDR